MTEFVKDKRNLSQAQRNKINAALPSKIKEAHELHPCNGMIPVVFSATTFDNQIHIGVRFSKEGTKVGDYQHYDHGAGINRNEDARIEYVYRCAKDIKGTYLKENDRVCCINDEEGGDSSSDFDLKAGRIYTIDEEHDEDGLLSPMIFLKESDNGAVFPERFIKVID